MNHIVLEWIDLKSPYAPIVEIESTYITLLTLFAVFTIFPMGLQILRFFVQNLRVFFLLIST